MLCNQLQTHLPECVCVCVFELIHMTIIGTRTAVSFGYSFKLVCCSHRMTWPRLPCRPPDIRPHREGCCAVIRLLVIINPGDPRWGYGPIN